jgi:glycerate kinase
VKIVIAPQTFKGALSGLQVAKAIGDGVLRVFPEAEIVHVPVADGGDGTLEALVEATQGQFFTMGVVGPLGDSVDAQWGAMGDGKTAVIEMARASGLVLVPPNRRDPRITTTFGTGQLIKQALDRGYKRIITAIGGSATNDGGAGMAQALGARLVDENGKELSHGGAALARLARIDLSRLHPATKNVEVIIASDVNNPLCGPTGASAVYGPQKGATPEMVRELDAALKHYAEIVKRDVSKNVADVPGAGAAGGLGFGLMAFLNATTRSGIDLVCDVLNIDGKLKDASLVITGEGRIDSSTVFNKAPVGVARRAKKYGLPVLAIAGSLGPGYEQVYQHGIDAVTAIQDRPMSMEDSLSKTAELLRGAAERTMHLIRLGKSWSA